MTTYTKYCIILWCFKLGILEMSVSQFTWEVTKVTLMWKCVQSQATKVQ